jgi:hypothetical protein
VCLYVCDQETPKGRPKVRPGLYASVNDELPTDSSRCQCFIVMAVHLPLLLSLSSRNSTTLSRLGGIVPSVLAIRTKVLGLKPG